MIYLRMPNYKIRNFKEYSYIEFDPYTLTLKEFMDKVGKILTSIIDRRFDYDTFLSNTYLEIKYEEHDSDMRIGYYETCGGALLDDGTHSESELIYAAADIMNEMFQNPNNETRYLKEYRFTFSNRAQAIRSSSGNGSLQFIMDKPTINMFDDNESIIEEMDRRKEEIRKFFERIARPVNNT